MRATTAKPKKQDQPEHRDERGYNGWTNYETWCVHLWLSNDQSTYNTIHKIVAEAKTRTKAGQAVREQVENRNPLAGQASLYADLINATLSEVNWEEVAGAFSENS